MMTYTSNPSTCQVEAGGLGVQSQPWIQSRLEASLGYMKLCQWTKGKREGGKETKRKTAPIPISSHVSKTHVLWLKSQEPGYYAKCSCILESHRLESSGHVKPMYPTVMNDNFLSPLPSSFFLGFVVKWDAAGLGAMDPWMLQRALGLWDNEEKKDSMTEIVSLPHLHLEWYPHPSW